MNQKILLINCYHEKKEEKIAPYFGFIEAAARAANLSATIFVIADETIHLGATIPGHDAAIVSGAHRNISQGGFFPGFVDFLTNRQRPLLGICYGHQVLAHAFGAGVKKDSRRHDGDEEITLSKADPLFAGFPPRFAMSESHEEIVVEDPLLLGRFDLLAVNGEKNVEAIRHRGMPFWGVQFHPERSGEPGLMLIGNFLKQVKPVA